MKSLLITILLLTGAFTGLHAQTMYVKENSGTQISYLISHLTKITFSPGNIQVSKEDRTTDTYVLKGVRYINFSQHKTHDLPLVRTKNITVELLADGTATIAEDAVNNGSVDTCAILSYDTNITRFSCADVNHPVTVTLTVTNILGHQNSQTALVTVKDHIAPEVMTQPITVYLDENGMASISENTVNEGLTDACGIRSYDTDITHFDCADVNHPVTVTFTATDIYGNSKSKTAVVTVEDQLAPVVETQPISVQLSTDGTATIAQDAVNKGSNDACGIQSFHTDITRFTTADVNHPVTVVLTVTDVHGNSQTKSALVSVETATGVASQPHLTLQMYPNPVSDELSIVLPTEQNQGGTIEILSIAGKEIYTRAIVPPTNVYQINVTALAPGNYLCRITNGTRIETRKFVKR